MFQTKIEALKNVKQLGADGILLSNYDNFTFSFLYDELGIAPVCLYRCDNKQNFAHYEVQPPFKSSNFNDNRFDYICDYRTIKPTFNLV